MSIAQRIEFFNFIRDIPYKVALDEGEQDYCCSTKALMLGELLEGLGLKTRQVLCRFDWRKTPIPEHVLSLPFDAAETTHQYLQAFIPEEEKWVTIDPTWDAALQDLGFAIETWDGLNDTGIAVTPLKILSAQETQELIEKYDQPSIMDAYMAYHSAFFNAVNKWMATARIHA